MGGHPQNRGFQTFFWLRESLSRMILGQAMSERLSNDFCRRSVSGHLQWYRRMKTVLFRPFFGKCVNLTPGEAEKGEMGEKGSARTAPKTVVHPF